MKPFLALILCAVIFPPAVLSIHQAVADTPGKNAAVTQPDFEGLTVELQRKRRLAAEELEARDRPAGARKGAPPGVPEADISERRMLMQQLVQIYAQHIDEVHKLAETRQHLEAVKQQNKEWNGFSTPPPYSVLMVDDLRDASRSAMLTAQSLETRLSMTEGQLEATQRNLEKLQEQVRQTAERAESLQDPVQKERTAWASQLAQLRERVAAARASMLDTIKRHVEAETAEIRERQTLLDRQRKVAEQNTVFTQEDYEKVTKRVDATSQAVSAEIERALSEQTPPATTTCRSRRAVGRSAAGDAPGREAGRARRSWRVHHSTYRGRGSGA